MIICPLQIEDNFARALLVSLWLYIAAYHSHHMSLMRICTINPLCSWQPAATYSAYHFWLAMTSLSSNTREFLAGTRSEHDHTLRLSACLQLFDKKSAAMSWRSGRLARLSRKISSFPWPVLSLHTAFGFMGLVLLAGAASSTIVLEDFRFSTACDTGPLPDLNGAMRFLIRSKLSCCCCCRSSLGKCVGKRAALRV